MKAKKLPPAKKKRTKECLICGRTKRLGLFKKNEFTEDGHHNICMACDAESGKAIIEKRAYANLIMAVLKNPILAIENPAKVLGSSASVDKQIQWLKDLIEWTYGNNFWFEAAGELNLCNVGELRKVVRKLSADKLTKLELL